MKNSIKFCALLLCAILLLSTLTSCGKKEEADDRDFSLSTLSPVDPNTIPEGAKELSDVKPGTYTVLCHNGASGLLSTSGEGADTLTKEIYLRNAELKEKYSIELKELNITGKTMDFVRNSTLSGLVNYDIASLTYRDAMLLTVSNSLCAMSDLGGYYQNRDMFSPDLSVGGKQYIVDFSIFTPRIDGTYALALNRAKMKNPDVEESISLLIAHGEWTYDTVHSFMRGNGTLGLSDMTALWIGGGIAFYENGTDGLPSYKKLGTKAKDIYTALKLLNDEGYLERTARTEGENTFAKIAKKTLLTVGTVAEIRAAMDEGLDLAILPMPTLEKSDKYSSFVSPESLCTVIPSGNESKNSVAFALTEMLYDYDLDKVRRDEITALAGEKNSRAGELFDIILSSRTHDLPALYDIGGLYDFLDESLRYNMLPDAFLEGIDDRIQTSVVAIEIMRENGH